MTDTPELLLAHHLKTLRLPTFLREHDKQARICAAEGVDHVRYLARLKVQWQVNQKPTYSGFENSLFSKWARPGHLFAVQLSALACITLGRRSSV